MTIAHKGQFLQQCNVLSRGVTTLSIVFLAAACSPSEPVSSSANESASQTTIAAIIEAPVDGEPVTLQGYVLRPGDDDTDFIFTDGTDEIAVEIYDEDFVADPELLVAITGEVDLEAEDDSQVEENPEEVEIDVYQIEEVNP